jgi:hypothetical protein
MYADWRPAGASEPLRVKLWDAPDSPKGQVFEALLMAQTPQYEARARGVARLLQGRDILNVCGELNTLAHHEHAFTLGLNQNAFGGAYYASALMHLIRGGADMEMRWTATSKRWDGVDDTYGLMSIDGEPTAACLAKELFAQHVRYGDWVRFPERRDGGAGVDAIVAWDDGGRRSGVFVNTAPTPRDVTIADWDEMLAACGTVLRLGAGTGNRVASGPAGRTVRLDGYGLAVVTNAAFAREIT